MKKNDCIDPLAELGDALVAKWNREYARRDQYSYDPKTDTIVSDTGTGLHFTTHLRQVLGDIRINKSRKRNSRR